MHVKAHSTLKDVQANIISPFHRKGNCKADERAKKGTELARSSPNDVHFLERCRLVASQVCRHVVRLTAMVVDTDLRDQVGLMRPKKIDLGAWPPDFSYLESDGESEGGPREALGTLEAGSVDPTPWKIRVHLVLETCVREDPF